MTSKLDYDNEGENYYFCEDLQLMRPLKRVKEFDKMWKQGIHGDEIAKILDWDEDLVAIAVVDRKRRGKIRNRKGGYMGG